MTSGPVVVTGAAGFVGRALCAHFNAAGRAHRAVVRTPEANANRGAIALGDLAAASEADLAAALAGASAVVHLAGRTHVMHEGADAAESYRAANVVATERLAIAAVEAGVRRFILASTVKVHGEMSRPGHPIRSDDAYAPADSYARSKVEAERALHAVCAGTSMAAIVLRPPLLYGPGVGGNFLALVDAIARRAWLPVGAIDNRRDLLYVGNLVHAIAALIDCDARPDGAWLVADGEPISSPDLVRAIGKQLGVAPRLLAVPMPLLAIAARFTGREQEVQRLGQSLEVDASPLVRLIGALPHGRDEGLAQTIRWWRARHAL